MRLRVSIAIFFLAASLASAGVARAGGPWWVDEVNDSGVASRWEGNTFKYCVDPGDLSASASNSEAKAWVSEMLAKWAGVKLNMIDTISLTVGLQSSGCPTDDIDATNVGEYGSYEAGVPVIVFDDTGDIIAGSQGEENRDLILGLSSPLWPYPPDTTITKGIAIFNGRMLENGTLGATSTEAKEYFKGTVLHELGHVLNLDHSQTNYESYRTCEPQQTCENAGYIPTMFPILITKMQAVLKRDDEVAISSLYPSAEFDSNFCTIKGQVFDGNNNPLNGVHVTATRAAEGVTPYVEARSAVTGANYDGCKGDGSYVIRGIVPNKAYKVSYSELGGDYGGASSFEPLGENSPTGFDSESIAYTDGETTVMCTTGGETISMASAVIDTANYCAGSDGGGGDDDGGGGKASALSCSLVTAGSNAVGAPFASLAAVAIATLTIALRRASSRRRG